MRRHLVVLPILIATALVAGASGLLPAPAGAVVTHTVTTVDDTVNGGDGLLSLREAVTEANADGDSSTVVLAANATYSLDLCDLGSPNEIANASGDLNLLNDSPVTIVGNGSTVAQTCAGEGVVAAFTPLTATDLHVTGGDLGVASLLAGGGINGSTVSLTDSTVTDSTATFGGGISANNLVLVRSVVADNTGSSGGGIHLDGSSPNLDATDSSIVGNTANSTPGVQFNLPGDAELTNVTIGGSTALSVNGSIGSELNNAGSATLTHTTIQGTANGVPLRVGGTLTAFGSVVDDGGATLTCISMGTTNSLGHNIESDGDCGFDDTTDQTSVGDLGLAAPADNGGPGPTILPTPTGHPVDNIPVGDCDPAVTADARGVARPQGDGCDSGAVEREPVRLVDGLIRTSAQATFGGDGVRNLTGVGQTRQLNKARGQKAVFFVRAQNDGDADDDLRIKGPGSANGFTVRYFVGPTNVTAAVVAGTHTFADVAPGGTATVRVEVTVGQGPRNVVRNHLVRVTSAADPTERDVVKAAVKRVA